MPNGDQGLAQAVYGAQLYAAKNVCQCTACQLLRKASDGMITQVLAGNIPGLGAIDPTVAAQAMGGTGGPKEGQT